MAHPTRIAVPTTESTADAPPMLTPKLRFPEFQRRKGWSRTPLKNVLSESGLKSDGKSEVHSVSLTSGVVSQVEHMGRSYAAADTSHYTLVRPFDVVYTRSPLAEFRLGIVKQHRRSHNAIVSPLYGVFTPANRYVGQLVEAFFDSPARSVGLLDPLAQKGAKNTIHLTNDRFLAGQIYLPQDEPEQQKIADCLTSLDEQIAAQGRKVEALKAHKMGLMQHLFPQKGQTLPRLRFPEFRGDGEWEGATVGSRSASFSGGTPDTANKDFYGGDIPFIRSAEIARASTELSLTEDGLEASAAKMVEKGDVLVALYGANSGDVALSRVGGAINQAILCIRPRGSKAFLYHALTERQPWILATYIQGGQGNLSGEIVKSIPLRFPSLKEQDAVADCLSAADAVIAAAELSLNLLRTHKAGLMQRLFPRPTRD